MPVEINGKAVKSVCDLNGWDMVIEWDGGLIYLFQIA